MSVLPGERLRLLSRQVYLILLRKACVLVVLVAGVLLAEAVSTPLPADIAARIAVRAAIARKASTNVRAYLLYSEAAKLDPLNPDYRQNRDELEPFAKLLLLQKLESADIQGDIAACALEATPGSDSSIAVHLAEKAEQARKTGQTVRAYLLYSAAANRYPANAGYRENRDVLAPLASLLQQSQLEQSDITADVKAAEIESRRGTDPSIKEAAAPWQSDANLVGLPHVVPTAEHHDFDLSGDPKTLIEQVTSAYGVRTIIDPDLPKTGKFAIQLTDADFRTAMDALTVVTNTFMFPVSSKVLFFAEDSETKRNELEPNILLTVSLPDSLGEKDLIEVANGVRSVLNLKNFGWDSINHTVVIRDRFTRAHLAQSLLESLLIPHAQISLELQFITLDSDVAYHWGIAPQTSFQFLSPLAKLFNFNTVLPTLATGAQFIAVGGGLSTFGLGITSAQAFATYSSSLARTTYDATVIVQDGETANLHVGEKYPIPQSLYTGASHTASSIYNPIGAFTQEDLGLVLKVTPHVRGDGSVGMEIDAEYKALGTQTFNTVPSVSERKFTGSLVLRENEWAVLAGLDQNSVARTRSGFAGLTDIPGLNHLLSENNRDKTGSETLVVLKPVVTRLPMSDAISPQFLVGPVRGVRVLL